MTTDQNNELTTVNDFVHFVLEELTNKGAYFGHGIDNGWDEAVYLVLGTLGLPMDSDEQILTYELTEEEKRFLLNNIDKRVNDKIPVPYLMKEAWFAGLPFYVNQDVLIPRSPLAELIISRFEPWADYEKVTNILDIGTGSGCIAIACAHYFPNANIDAVDISERALKVATENCVRHQVTGRVNLFESDLFMELPSKTYDIIVSNPPYVGKDEMLTLPKEYIYEPELALLGGELGDEIVRRILAGAASYLKSSGILVVEVGNSAPIIIEKYPHLPFVWLEFEQGEAEVFLLTREQLLSIN